MKKEEEVKKSTKRVQPDDRMKLMSDIWGKRKLKRLNQVIDDKYCGSLTIRELACLVLADKLNFPQGLDTPLCIGDFEGNFCTNTLSVSTSGKWGPKSWHLCLMGDPNGYMN